MEGGQFPWKTQVIKPMSPDLDSYGKPLPSPPFGSYWEKNADGSWHLMKLGKDLEDADDFVVFKEDSVIEHVVMPDETIQGLCLRYRISPTELRRYNLFSGNNIQIKKTLRIPIKAGTPTITQVDSCEVMIQRFKNETDESHLEARIYLEDSNWNYNLAFKKWQEDKEWEDRYQANSIVNATNTREADTTVPRRTEITLVEGEIRGIDVVIPAMIMEGYHEVIPSRVEEGWAGVDHNLMTEYDNGWEICSLATANSSIE